MQANLIVSAGYGASSANNQGVADQRLANLQKKMSYGKKFACCKSRSCIASG